MDFERGDRVLVNGKQDGVFFHNEVGVVKSLFSHTCEIQFDDWFGGWGTYSSQWNVDKKLISPLTNEPDPQIDISIKLETLFES